MLSLRSQGSDPQLDRTAPWVLIGNAVEQLPNHWHGNLKTFEDKPRSRQAGKPASQYGQQYNNANDDTTTTTTTTTDAAAAAATSTTNTNNNHNHNRNHQHHTYNNTPRPDKQAAEAAKATKALCNARQVKRKTQNYNISITTQQYLTIKQDHMLNT